MLVGGFSRLAAVVYHRVALVIQAVHLLAGSFHQQPDDEDRQDENDDDRDDPRNIFGFIFRKIEKFHKIVTTFRLQVSIVLYMNLISSYGLSGEHFMAIGRHSIQHP